MGQARKRHRSPPRLHTALVAFLALLLGSVHHPEGRLAGAPSAGSLGLLSTVSHPMRAADVARELSLANPALPSEELQRIGAAVIRYSRKYRLDPDLVTAVIQVESSARPGARSRKGAVGLMQVMPHMLARLQLAGNFTSVESNIEAGCVILAGNIRRLGERDGILAYFWGSDIRGTAYFERVSAARSRMRRRLRS
jgi:hypothetical protein